MTLRLGLQTQCTPEYLLGWGHISQEERSESFSCPTQTCLALSSNHWPNAALGGKVAEICFLPNGWKPESVTGPSDQLAQYRGYVVPSEAT